METLKLMSYQVNYISREGLSNAGFGDLNSYGPKITEIDDSCRQISDFSKYGTNNIPAAYRGLVATEDSLTSQMISPVLSQSDNSLQQNGCSMLQTSPDTREGSFKSCTPSPSIGSLTPSPTPPIEQVSSPSSPETVISDIDEVLKSLENTAKGGDSKADKPHHSYVKLIVDAILSKPEKRIILSDIYKYIQDNFEYYNNEERAWRNSIRHNLSLNECFIKAGRADSGKGNYWSIHPACIEDFSKGDYRKRNARRRAKRGSRSLQAQQPSTPYPYRQYVPMSSDTVSYPTPLPYPYQMPTISQMPPQPHLQAPSIGYLGKYQQPMTAAYGQQVSMPDPLTAAYSSQPRATISYEPQTSMTSMDLYRPPYTYPSGNSGYHSNASMMHYPAINQGH
ncbi:unnamed protein product [Owenia fusiformis]|uniref:Uncharacterized protein n=1 Tax=Owenia fusiformis TaxID=6347 RepID=A0A8J1TGZ0_OWEFU|nr:unnamed protein product [Owenia fusiformis]